MRKELLKELIDLLKTDRPEIGVMFPDCQVSEFGETEQIIYENNKWFISMSVVYGYMPKEKGHGWEDRVELIEIELSHEDFDFGVLSNYELDMIFKGVLYGQNRGSVNLPTEEDFNNSVNDWLKIIL
jgi:hypothetical protein